LQAVTTQCWRRDRNIVSALSDQRGPLRGGLPARGGTACRTGQTSPSRRKSPQSRRYAAGCAPVWNSWRRRRAWRRSPWPCTVPRSWWSTRSRLTRQWGNCCGVPWQRARFVPKSTPRTCSVRWSGCATRDRPGWQAKVLGLIDIFIDGLRGDLKGETIDRPVTLFIRAALISPSAQACRLRGPTPQTA
jgi:hypothetical protein